MTDFPPNSERSREEPVGPEGPEREEKSIRPIAGATRRKTPLGKKFKGMFFSGDAKTAAGWVGMEVILPAIRDLIYEGGSAMLGRMIFGQAHRASRRGWNPPYQQGQPQSGPTGYVSYNRYAMNQPQQPPPRMLSRQARAQHNFDEIVMDSRGQAEEVIEQLFELVSRYESASVADLYTMVGLQATHVDNKWGWTDMRGSSVSPLRGGGGYLLNLPEPRPLN